MCACIPIIGEATLLSSPPELRKTSKASWSDMSIKSICSSMSTFTSIEDMLPIVSAYQRKSNNITFCNLTPQPARYQGFESRMNGVPISANTKRSNLVVRYTDLIYWANSWIRHLAVMLTLISLAHASQTQTAA